MVQKVTMPLSHREEMGKGLTSPLLTMRGP